MKKLLVALTLSCGLFGSVAAMADCTALINDAYSWAAKRDGRNEYRVGFQMSSMKGPTKFVHFSEGAFTLGAGGLLVADKVPAVFSDRAWCPNNSGPFCLPYQKFDYRKADQMSFTLQRSGVLKVVLNTWGNSTYNINLQCTSNFLYGTLNEANGTSFITMNLNKYSVEIPR